MFSQTNKKSVLLRTLVILSFILLSSVYTGSSNGLAQATVPLNIATQNLEDRTDNALNSRVSAENASDSHFLEYSALYDYIARRYIDDTPGFTDESGFYTSLAAYYGYLSLKMTGLEKYLVPTETTKVQMYDRILKYMAIDADLTYGFAINRSFTPSLKGTFTVLGFLEASNHAKLNEQDTILNCADFVKNETLVKIDDTHFAFQEEDDPAPTLVAIYYALEILDILQRPFNTTMLSYIANYIANYWNVNGYFMDNDARYNAVMDTYFAAYSLNIIQSYGASLPIALNNYNTTLKTWLESLQISGWGGLGLGDGKTGFYNISNIVTSNTPTVEETGAALAIFRKFGWLNQSTTTMNITNAVNFIVDSQFMNRTDYYGHGGFSPSNITHKPDVNAYVTIERTFWALLGLFSTDYFMNNLNMTMESSFYRTSTTGPKTYEVIQGDSNNVYLYFRVFYNNSKSMSAGMFNVNNTATNWNITYASLSPDNREDKYQNIYSYKLKINLNGTTDWSLGNHSFIASYSVANFSLFPVTTKEFTFNVSVRLGFSLPSPVDEGANGSMSPGEKISFLINAYNKTYNATTHIYNTNYFPVGNVTSKLVQPNGTFVPLLSAEAEFLWPTGANSTYLNVTLPNFIHLGEYKIQVTHWNNVTIYSHSSIGFTVSDNVYLHAIGNNINQIPGTNYTLNFAVFYRTKQILIPHDANISIGFVSKATNTKIFSEKLQWDQMIFVVNTSSRVPNQILMGEYNLSLTVFWKRADGYYFTNPKEVINSTLSRVTIVGSPVLRNITAQPFDGRTNRTVYLGEQINITAIIGILIPNGSVVAVNESITLQGLVVNRTNAVILQNLNSTLIKNTVGNINDTVSFTGYIDPNLKLGDYYGFKAQVKSRYNNSYVPLIDKSTNLPYIFNFTLVGQLKLKQHLFIIPAGVSTVNPETTPYVVVEFNVTCVNDGAVENSVSGLQLIAKLRSSTYTIAQNKTAAVISVSIVGNTYQVVIPVVVQADGQYYVDIYKQTMDEYLGSYSLTITRPTETGPVPLINYIALGIGVLLAVIVIANIIIRLRTY